MQIGKWNITKKDLVWIIILLISIICFGIALFIYKQDSAMDILSGASTAVSIVLSVVAILYTMIEGANSSRVNQEAINKLDQLDVQLKIVSEKTNKMNEIEKQLKQIIPDVVETVKAVEAKSTGTTSAVFDEETLKKIEQLKNYIDEDVDA